MATEATPVTPPAPRPEAQESRPGGGPGGDLSRRALASHLEQRYGLSYDPEGETIVTVGASEAVAVAMAALIDPGDEVILHEPPYVAYLPAIIFNGGVPRLIPTRLPGEVQPDPAAG